MASHAPGRKNVADDRGPESHRPLPSRTPRILIADPHDDDRERLAADFRRLRWSVQVTDGRRRLDPFRIFPTLDLIVTECIFAHNIDDVLVREVTEHSDGPSWVIVTRSGSFANATKALHRGARAYLTKPVLAPEVINAAVAPTSSRFVMMSLARAEWEYISRVLQCCQGNKTRAARHLGILRSTLQRKLGKNPPNI